MKWNDLDVLKLIEPVLAARVEKAGEHVRDYIKEALSRNVGSVVPFVVSKAGEEYPYLWDGRLRDSIAYVQGSTPLQAIIFSDAVDQDGHHFSWDEERGAWWDGIAYDFQTGKYVKVAPPHNVEGRRFMEMGLTDCTPKVLSILTGKE